MTAVDLSLPQRVTLERALRGKRIDTVGLAFQAMLMLSLFVVLAIIVALVAQVLGDGASVYQERGFVLSRWPDEIANTVSDIVTFVVQPEGVPGWIFSVVVILLVPYGIYRAFRRSVKTGLGVVATLAIIIVVAGFVQTSPFVTSSLSRFDERAGIAQAIFGSLVLAAIVLAVAVPLGVATAMYLEEYAPDNRLTRLVRLNIRNLAGVPSVVYGLLGLAVFVELVGTDIGDFPLIGGFLQDVFGENGLTGGRTIIAGGLTLAIVVLPIVIITASESIRAVPQSLREGGYGVGATKWEVQRTLVLPNAMGGIMTGTILSVSRAIGETAPLILVGAVTGTFFTTGSANFWEKFQAPFTALPQVVYQWSTEPSAEFKVSLTAAAILALLVVTFIANIAAILLRNRYEKRW